MQKRWKKWFSILLIVIVLVNVSLFFSLLSHDNKFYDNKFFIEGFTAGIVIAVVIIISTLFIKKYKKQIQQLKEYAYRDSLTGCLNRRAMEELLAGAFPARGQTRLTLLYMDIDFFKEVNDTHGHAAGDRALVELAGILRAFFPENETVCRWGGEEFLVLLRDEQDPEKISDRLREAVAANRINLTDKQLCVTASVGAADMLPEDSTYTDVVNRADTAMYAAKQKGRNCTVMI